MDLKISRNPENKRKNNRTKFLAACLILLLVFSSFTACSSRKKETTPPPKELPPPSQTLPEEPKPPENPPPGESAPDENADQPGESTTKIPSTVDALSAPSLPEADLNKTQPPPTAQTSETLSGDFAQLAGLSAKKLGWGSGGPVDGLNRSSGALSYQELYGKYDADFIGENQQKIYLTFDEGYENGFTGKILDVLKEKQVSAVFFVTMPYVKANQQLIQRMIDEGHQVGNHSVTHPSFPETPLTQCQEEITQLHRYLLEEFEYEMKLFRFPMGEFNEQDLKLVQECGYRSVFWSFAYKDWLVDDQPEEEEALSKILSHCHPGGIFLLHAVSETNTNILGRAIDEIQSKGYEFAAYPVQ